MANCVRCGKIIYKGLHSTRLWCDDCRKLIDEEIGGEVDRPFEFYFKYHLRHNKR